MSDSQPQAVDRAELPETQKSVESNDVITNKTQAINSPNESLSPALAQSPAQSENVTPTPASLKVKQACMLMQNANWLQTTSEKIEKTIELINIKKIKEALQILLELDSVFESSGICISANNEEGKSGMASTRSASPPIQKTGSETPIALRNKSAFQLAIITKYNLACCFQSLGESQKCIKYLQSASKQLNYYSTNIDNNKGLFKVDGNSSVANQNTNRHNTNAQSLEKEKMTPQSIGDTQVDFNEYNCMGMTPKKDQKEEEMKQTHEQLSAQLQANRYLCKFHLQLCAILSQMGQHTSANENGQRAAAIAEIILIKTHEFCQSSVEDILMKDNKQKSLLDQNVPESIGDSKSKEAKQDYTNSTVQSKMQQQKLGEKKGMTRGSSVTSLYSIEKERKSVSIRRSKSRGQAGRQREGDQETSDQDSTHKSLERMYTFNLSKATNKAARLKNKKEKQGKDGADPVKPDNNVRVTSPRKVGNGITDQSTPNLSNQVDQKEESKESLESERKPRDLKTDSRSANLNQKRSNSSNFVPTYQVLERTNIQEKQLLNIQPLLNEFNRIAAEFNRNNIIGFEDLTVHERTPCFGTVQEITTLKTNKRFKINVRNALGVKDHNNWIYNLNIGNVMNLTPMNSDELNSQPDVFQELSKDTMLEKIILYVVAYFCVGTEIRFQATKMEKKESPQEYFKVWSSEMWHGKSLQTACLFLPEDCPLVDHIIKSYKKHYIGKTSLLSVVVQPKPKVQPQTITEQTASPGTKNVLEMFQSRPQSQQQINNGQVHPPRSSTAKEHESRTKSPLIHQPINQPNQQKEVHETIKTVSCASSNAVTPASENATSDIPPSLSKQNKSQKVQSIKSSDQSHNINSSIGAQTNPIMLNENSINQASLIHNNLSTITQVIGKGSNDQAWVSNNGPLKATQNISKAKSLKRQATLQQLAMRSTILKHVENGVLSGVSTQQQHSKEPPKSPDDMLSPLEIAAQQESTKTVRQPQRNSLKKNKYPSATSIGLGNMEEESRNIVQYENKLRTENVQNKSPSVRRRGMHPISPQRYKSPKGLQKEQKELQQAHRRELAKQHQLMQEAELKPTFNTITFPNDIQRLKDNLNMQVQQKQLLPLQKQQNGFIELSDDMIDSEGLGSLIERPISAQHQRQYQTEHPNPTASQKSLTKFKGKVEQMSTPKRRSAIGNSRKRPQNGIGNSIQKLVQKPPGNSKHSKVLSMNMQAWSTTGASSAHNTSKPSSKQQKVVMLKKSQSKVQIQSPHVTTQASYLPSGAQTTTAPSAQQSIWLNDKQDQKKREIHAKLMNKLATNTARANIQAQHQKNQTTLQHSVTEDTRNFDQIMIDSQQKKNNTVAVPGQYQNPEFNSNQYTYSKKDGKGLLQQGIINMNIQPSASSSSTNQNSSGAQKPRLPSSKQNSNAMAVFQKGMGPLTQSYDATTGQHTLKKSSSTRQVVNLLDIQSSMRQNALQQQQPQNSSYENQTQNTHIKGLTCKGNPNFSQTQNLQPIQLGQQQSMSHLMQQIQTVTGIPAYTTQGFSKKLTKKGKNASSTGMLHHYN